MQKLEIDLSSLKNRFIKYVQVDTQSDPGSLSFPSTEKQKDLGRILVQELLDLGIADAHLDEYGYVYATINANVDTPAPTICFCAHMDTAPDCSGKNVKPIVHQNYQGQDLVLPDDPAVVIKMNDHPDLPQQLGHDIVTASGTTLLGADNKAGVAAIMEAARFILQNPTIKHGNIKILFTPDEEVGRGVDYVDLNKLGAQVAYTIDGETRGSIEDETFSADAAKLTVTGVSAHPGFAKGKMESALKILSQIITNLPKELSAEHTSGMEGFIHPVTINGTADMAEAHFILRDFDNKKLAEHAIKLDMVVKSVVATFPNATYQLEVKEQYRNMKQVLDENPAIVEIGLEAIKRAGMEPLKRSIRGGTDGSRLSFMGLPCPNIFAGEHAFHGKQEWVSVQDMGKSAETMVHIAQLWAQRNS